MTKEEKAREYGKNQFRDISANFTRADIREAYTAGYTQAEQDLSSQLAAYKEALRELVDHIEDSCIDWKVGDELVYKTIIAPEVLKKSKQLLNNE